MAKRKRLTPAEINALEPGTLRAPEIKSIDHIPIGVVPKSALRRPPIAQVAGDAAAQAALDEVAEELRSAKAEGRMVQSLPLAAIDANHLVRDRMVSDDDEMDALKSSIMARGQQTPIEVIDLGQGRFGLISGWRRLTAMKQLFEDTGEARFGQIQCLLRRPEGAADAYLAMVEENEIRVGLSYYERARIAALAADRGVYPTVQLAVRGLFANASRAKRSKIMTFTMVFDVLDDALKYPTALPERLGLAVAKALNDSTDMAIEMRRALQGANVDNAAEEQAILAGILKPDPKTKAAPAAADIVPGINMQRAGRKLVLTGAGVTDDLRDELEAWLKSRG